MQLNKKARRLKRAKKTRFNIKGQNKARLVVYKSNKNIYAQVIDSAANHSDMVVAAATAKGSNIEAAKKVGAAIAEKSLANKVDTIAFDRSGYKYHGCIKALADAAREAGLKF